MDHGYKGRPRYDDDGDVVMWNTNIPYMPTEIIEIIAECCDWSTLKALRLTNSSCEFATRPSFEKAFHEMTMEITLKDQTPSLRHLQSIAQDANKCKLVRKVIVTVKTDLMFSEDRSWQRQLGPIKEQKKINSQMIIYFAWLFQRLYHCCHLEIAEPARIEGKKGSSFTESRVFGFSVWPIIIAASNSPAIRQISHPTTTSVYDTVQLSQPGGPLYPSKWSINLSHLEELELNIGTCANDRVWSPPNIWRRLFATMTNIFRLTLTIEPLLKRHEEGWQADWRSSNELIKALNASHGDMRELGQLCLQVKGLNDVSDLCACMSTYYTRIMGIWFHVEVARPTELNKVVRMLDSLRLKETPLRALGFSAKAWFLVNNPVNQAQYGLNSERTKDMRCFWFGYKAVRDEFMRDMIVTLQDFIAQ